MHSFEAQQRQARLQAFIDFKVKHPRLEEIDDTLMQAIHGHRTYTLLPIYGAGGVGKSTVLKHVAESCRTLLEQVPLIVDVPGLLTHWRWFGGWSLGCIGVLSDWIVETVDALYRQGATTLTIDALQKHALPPGLRARMESEARAGEFKMDQAKAQMHVFWGSPN